MNLLESGTIDINKWNSPTSFNSSYGGLLFTSDWRRFHKPLYLRIVDDGTNRLYQMSPDGSSFYTMKSVLRTDFLTPDQYGFQVNGETSITDVVATYFSSTFT